MSSCEIMRTSRAQWRGLEFEWLDEGHSGGNRLAIHKYVDRDTHSVKPLGCEEQRWTVRGYICGDRLRDRVRDFRDAFKHSQQRRGPGRLYDPWQNEDFTAYVETWNITPNKNILGTEFTATFVEAGEEPYPIATASPLAAFADAIEQLEADSAASFTTTFGVANERAVAVGSAIADAGAVWGYLGDSYRVAYQPGALIDLSAPDAFGIVSELHDDNLAAIFDSVDDTFSDARAEAFYTRNIFIDLAPIDPNSPGAAVAIENSNALAALLARTSFARLAAVVINQPYPTREHAQDAVDRLATYANELTRFDTPSDDPQIARDIQCILTIASQIPADLPPLKIWTATTRQTSLVLAHDIYCDIGRANELAMLNNALTAMPAEPCYAAS